MLHRGYQARRPLARGRHANAVTGYQRPLKLKRLLRSVYFCLAAVIVVAATGWFSVVLLAESDIFRVSSVEVSGNRVLTEQQVLDSSGLSLGTNMLDFELRQIEGKVRNLPWIDEVTVQRSWPSTVEIAVREHKPLALINLPEGGRRQLHYVDTDGHVFVPAEGDTDLDFPVLTGNGLDGDIDGMDIRPDSLSAKAMYFLKLAAQGSQILPLQAVSEIRVSREQGLIVYLADHPFPIYMGGEKIRERYYLLVRLLAQLYNKDKIADIKEIHMNYAEDKIMVASVGNS